jgi:hypothetical protein
MDAGLLLPMVPFVVLLFTELRVAVMLSAAAGLAAGWWIETIAFRPTEWWWAIVLYALAVSGGMAVAESLVAAVILRGRFFRALGLAILAHLLWLAWLAFGIDRPHEGIVLLMQTAMVGASAATFGAFRRW